MKLSKIWRTVVQTQEEICNSYARMIEGFKPLKCKYMAICTPKDGMKVYWSLEECIFWDGVEYMIDHITMYTSDNDFTIYVYVK